MKRIAIAVAALPLLVAGCGGADRGAPAAATQPPRTVLHVTIWPAGTSGAKQAHDVTCPDTGGNAACTALRAAPRDLFAPLPKDVVCTQVYGGPGKARISGTLDGRPVDATFSRANGCEVSRWQRLVQLGMLPAGLGGPAS